MEDINLSNSELLSIIKKKGNETCADCNEKNPLWCSINNGVLICPKCTRKHRKFGEKISKIKSLEVDEWDKDELMILQKGGNERFNNLIQEYKIPLIKENQEYKYYTKIADYYRKILKEEIKGNYINLNKPSLKEGIQKIVFEEKENITNENINKPENNYFENINEIPQNMIYYSHNDNDKINNNIINHPYIFAQNNQNLNKQQSNFSTNSFHQNNTYLNNQNQNSFQQNNININSPNQNVYQNVNYANQGYTNNNWNNIVNSINSFFSDVGKKISNTMKDYEIDKRINSTASYLANKGEEVANSEIVKNLAQSAEESFNTLKRKTNEIMNNNSYYNINNNETIQQEKKTELNLINNNDENNKIPNNNNEIKENNNSKEESNNEEIDGMIINQPKIHDIPNYKQNNLNDIYKPKEIKDDKNIEEIPLDI